MDKKIEPADLANEHLAELLKKTKDSKIRTKLKNLHDVCETIVDTIKMRLTVPLVLRHYRARFPDPAQSIADSSIRNKRNGANPYQSLYRKWEQVADAIMAAAASNTAVLDAGIIGESDVRRITPSHLPHTYRVVLGGVSERGVIDADLQAAII
jgi:hypothetical protein